LRLAGGWVLKLSPDAPDVGGHRVETAPLAAALNSLRHDQPQDDVQEDSDPLDEDQDEEGHADP